MKGLHETLQGLESGDRRLLDAVGEAMAEAARRAGDRLHCYPGCDQCCHGPFAISALDALRLRRGLAHLRATDPARASRVAARAEAYLASIAQERPDGARTWDESSLPESLDEMPCPALDPASGCCDLYEARPIVCRTFGPAIRLSQGTVGACELCYVGTPEDELSRIAVDVDPDGLERALLARLAAAGQGGLTIIAEALAA